MLKLLFPHSVPGPDSQINGKFFSLISIPCTLRPQFWSRGWHNCLIYIRLGIWMDIHTNASPHPFLTAFFCLHICVTQIFCRQRKSQNIEFVALYEMRGVNGKQRERGNRIKVCKSCPQPPSHPVPLTAMTYKLNVCQFVACNTNKVRN